MFHETRPTAFKKFFVYQAESKPNSLYTTNAMVRDRPGYMMSYAKDNPRHTGTSSQRRMTVASTEMRPAGIGL